jgi:hypothetical protein
MSYTYLLEQGEESSAASFSDIPQSVLSRLNLIAGKSCCKGSGTESCQSSQSGMMSPHSMELRGEEKSMSSVEDSLARISQAQGGGLELKANEADSGQKWPESLAKYDPNTRSWRTAQCLLFEDSTESLETFPRWGMMRDGELWEQSTQVRRTDEIESGLWPTPTGQDNAQVQGQGKAANHPKRGTTLGGAVRMWPTPCASEARQGYQNRNNGKKGTQESLSTAVRMWLTPRTRGLCGGTGHKEMLIQKIGKEEGVKIFNGGQMNPNWVEWLMGWPIGWTDLKPLETGKFQQWQHSHSKFLEGISND